MFMLINYSIRSYEILHRALCTEEKTEVFDVFRRVALRMELGDFPSDLEEWEAQRESHLQENLIYSNFTADLYRQYKKHLGYIRFQLLKQAQAMVCPNRVRLLLQQSQLLWLKPVISFYKITRQLKVNHWLRNVILPKAYKFQTQHLDVHSN